MTAALSPPDRSDADGLPANGTRGCHPLWLREQSAAYTPESPNTDGASAVPFAEAQLTALWLLGRVPAALLAPWTLLRAGRAGRGPGPDVREVACALPTGVVLAGDVEVHLRASDWVRHGHASDPAYDGVVLHLVWDDDRPAPGTPQPLPGGGQARTLAVGPLLGFDPARLRMLLHRGPATIEPCADAVATLGPAEVARRLRRAGQQRLAERTWRAARLVAERGWDSAWAELLDRALRGSAGRAHEDEHTRCELARRITCGLGAEPVHALAALARDGRSADIIEALRGHQDDDARAALGAMRAAEVGWNAALPLLATLAAAYADVPLARSVAALVAGWPAPRPYGRTRALVSLLAASGPLPRDDGRAVHRARAGGVRGGGTLQAQGLLHTQELWCERGGCGLCPFSAGAEARV